MSRLLPTDPEAAVVEIQSALDNSAGEAARQFVVQNNSAPSRSLDVSSCTLGQLVAVVATLIQDTSETE
jgi:hypothetical protein